VVEDSPAGIASGLAAGASVVALATTYPVAALDGAKVVVDDLHAVTVTDPAGGSLRIRVSG
jgi:sugar-phosphatase